MARLLARAAPAGLWLFVAAAAASAAAASSEPTAGSTDRPPFAWGAAEPLPSDLAALAEAEEANRTEHLKAEIAYLHRELQHEAWRIEAAQSSIAESNATRRRLEEELERVRAETANATERAREARREAAKVQAQVEEARRSREQQEGPVPAWIAGLPHQQAIAVVLGIAGLLSIVGPSTFTRAFLAITGSAVSGLLVASCLNFFLEGSSWLGSVRSLVKGTGFFVGYSIWVLIFALGMVRWLVGFRCAPYASCDAEDSGSGSADHAGGNGLRQPLLATEGAPVDRQGDVPPPPPRPRSMRASNASSRGAVPRDAV